MEESEILEGLRPICLCKGVRKSALLKHIRSGVTDAGELKRLTGAGTGSCGGKRCDERIARLLEEVSLGR